MPVVSIAAVQLGFMLGGSVVIESVFALPGVGYLAWDWQGAVDPLKVSMGMYSGSFADP